jgi:hypothetical protein
MPRRWQAKKDAVTDDGEILPQGLERSHIIPLLVKSIHEVFDIADGVIFKMLDAQFSIGLGNFISVFVCVAFLIYICIQDISDLNT